MIFLIVQTMSLCEFFRENKYGSLDKKDSVVTNIQLLLTKGKGSKASDVDALKWWLEKVTGYMRHGFKMKK
jgi:hypothetical protein